MVILKATSLFDGHLMDIYMTCRITPFNGLLVRSTIFYLLGVLYC
jgi:hypothetical protein